MTAADPMFPGYTLEPIASAPRDGTVSLVKGGSTYASAHVSEATGDWILGHPENQTRVALDFEPTHWLRPPPSTSILATTDAVEKIDALDAAIDPASPPT